MYSSANVNSNKNRLHKYVVNEIIESNPQQLLIKVYDLAILHCQRHDLIKTNEVLQELITALRYDSDEMREISIGLLKLYQYSQDQMRKKNYEIVYKILTELRQTWVEAFQNAN